MGKKLFILIGCIAFMMLCGNLLFGQHGVLLPGNQDGNNSVSLRRGVETNPNPDFSKKDTLKNAKEVSVVFGAGESSTISNETVLWPFDHRTNGPGEAPSVGGLDYTGQLLIGSPYSRTAVVGIYDNNANASGAIDGIRLYGNTGGGTAPNQFYPPQNLNPLSALYASYFGGPYGSQNAYDAVGFSDPLNANRWTGTAATNYRYWEIDTMISSADIIPKNVARYFSDFSTTHPNGIASGLVTTLTWTGTNSGNDIFGSYYSHTAGVNMTNASYDYSGLVMARNDTAKNGNTSLVAAVLKPFYNEADHVYNVLVWNHISTYNAAGWNTTVDSLHANFQNQFFFTENTADTLYTSTRNDIGKTDNGKSLLYGISARYNGTNLNLYDDRLFNPPINPTPDYDTVKYIRPTTVLLGGDNTLGKISVSDVEWYAAFYTGDVDLSTMQIIGPFFAYNTSGCTHVSGYAAYKRYDAFFDTIVTRGSGLYVDAAVRIMDNADVCVIGTVQDSTTITVGAGSPIFSDAGPYSFDSKKADGTKNDTITDAVLVLPGMPNWQDVRSNFRLKIGGDALIRHLQDSNYFDVTSGVDPLAAGFLYRHWSSDATVDNPGDPFPSLATHSAQSIDIWLPGGDGTRTFDDEVAGMMWNYEHPRETGTLTYDNTNNPFGINTLSETLWMPYASTEASVYGVKGLYEGIANIHTRTYEDLTRVVPILANDTTNIIEIGSGTNNQDLFHIYSKGMLKNFRSTCRGNDCDQLILGDAAGNAPYFYLTSVENKYPLYIINDGDGSGGACCPGIKFNVPAVEHLNTAIEFAEGNGDLHIQAKGSIEFADDGPAPTSLDFIFRQTNDLDNEIKILSDGSFIHIENELNFLNADSAHLTIWANGSIGANDTRGFTDFECTETGAVVVEKDVNISYIGGTHIGNGLALIRSMYDDVLLNGQFSFTNTRAQNESGELMVQAGQDMRIKEATTLNQDGQRSMLFEAKKTVAFEGDFTANIGKRGSTFADSVMRNGDLTIKAGYPDFLPTADVTWPLAWGVGACVLDVGYENREANQDLLRTGGDIWFKGDVNILLTPEYSDSVDVYIRAYNSIHKDESFNFSLSSVGVNSVTPRLSDTTLTYAETGNIEALIHADQNASVNYSFSPNDSVFFLYQAGNKLGNPCGITNCFDPDFGQWYSNILYNKPFTITHQGVGPTLISAARDIENQNGADFTFDYSNPGLGNEDNLLITAGRHIETHAPYWFNYNNLTSISNNITMRAGHQTQDCLFDLCKTPELASNLPYNYLPTYTYDPDELNEFARDGRGHGSILLFDNVTFDYWGTGAISMLAQNGNIESDPYLPDGNGTAKIVYNHGGEGGTLMEAIDIKLHDILQYTASPSANNLNGQFTMHAFDSILTRSLYYMNRTDAGSVYITTDKYKQTLTACGETNYANENYGIHQGHIVLGYGSDCDNNQTLTDNIVFDFSGNPNTTGANLFIQAGNLGYDINPVTGKNSGLLNNRPVDRGKGYGGNITFDFMQITMAQGNAKLGGYTEISTLNGNIWGKDSLQYRGINGNLNIDAGYGSLEDTLHAARWSRFLNNNGAGSEDMLNTEVPLCCEPAAEWRTGNIMLKGGSVDFSTGSPNPGIGNVTFRTREGFIDIYDRFTASHMSGHMLMYAGVTDGRVKVNEWGDLSQRDFQYSPVVNSGSVFFGADDNIMLNYGYSNGNEPSYFFGANPNGYDVLGAGLVGASQYNPFYNTPYATADACYSIFNVNTNGYLWYKNYNPKRQYHYMYRGCTGVPGQTSSCGWLAGECKTIDNGARPLTFNFNLADDGTGTNTLADVQSGGLAVVASNYIDMFTAFTYEGGKGSGLHIVPEGMTTLKGENVAGYGLYIKSLFNGANPEKRRMTCFDCDESDDYNWSEWPYIGFHDDAHIYTQTQKSLIQGPVVEFFGNTLLDAETDKSLSRTELLVKADSLIFHDSAVFAGPLVKLQPFTTNQARRNANKIVAMRYGIVNDDDGTYYQEYGKAIQMTDRGLPVLEFGYQRCTEPPYAPNASPNRYSESGGEATPYVGGDIIVAFKWDFALPIYNTVVANHARISFLSDYFDGVKGGEYVSAIVRTDLLRIRNKVEFYTDPDDPKGRSGYFAMSTNQQIPTISESGMFPRHVHLEPGSELSLPGENSLLVISSTTLGGYGEAHENVFVQANGILAPGYASLMEWDCTSGKGQGTLKIHNLSMEKDAILRISMSSNNCVYNPETKREDLYCTQTDTLIVQDSIFFWGKIKMQVLPENDNIQPGCYLFMVYNEKNLGPEMLHNLELAETKIGDYHYYIDYMSEPGRVYLCVSETPTPYIQRYIQIHAIAGVTTNPVANMYHYVRSHDDFVFSATYSNKTEPFEVYAIGYYSQAKVVLPPKYLYEGTYEYIIKQVTEPWDIYFDPEKRGDVTDNVAILGEHVWAFRNVLYVNVDKDDVVSVYNMTGVLYKKLEITAGLNKLTLDKGVYLVKLKDGSTYRVIIN